MVVLVLADTVAPVVELADLVVQAPVVELEVMVA